MELKDQLKRKYFPVLDHGFIALVDYMGGDGCIEEAARASFKKTDRRKSDQRTLLRYLFRHAHMTPFEMVEFKFHLGLPLLVQQQLLRHRTASFNQYSGRYSPMPTLFYTPKKLSLQAEDNKQGRSEGFLDEQKYSYFIDKINKNRENVVKYYKECLDNDVAKELARTELPASTYTYTYFKCDLRNLLHFIGLRMDKHAQEEIRVYATRIAQIVREVAPLAYEAFEDYQLNAQKFSYQEMQLLLKMLTGEKSYPLTHKELITNGLSKREVLEMMKKLSFETIPLPEIDLSESKDISYFEEIIEKNTYDPKKNK